MAERCDTAAVLGAGVMGAGIAAHFAGAGIRTHLLDIVPPDLKGDEVDDPKARNRFAEQGIAGALKAKPAAFYDPDAARLITPGNFDDHLERLGECDLIVEAVVERMDIKKSLLGKVAKVIKPDAILASNTSGLSIAEIGEDLPDDVQKRLLVMHFFNPVRYMRLLEIVPGPKTDPAVVDRVARIGEDLGKGIVYGKDTPNFVANRIGVYGIMHAIHTMKADGYSIEEMDKILGKPMGRPGSAIFRTGDLVGIDTLGHVAKNCYDSLPDDEERDIFLMPEWVEQLVASGRTGQKARAGFYKKEGKEIKVLDPETLEYRSQEKISIDSLRAAKKVDDVGARIKLLVNADDRAGQLAWKMTSSTLAYTARRMNEIADDVVNIDRGMRWGFNWELGPFEIWDAIGVPESVERMINDGTDVPQWVLDMLDEGQTSFYSGTESDRKYFDTGTAKPASIPSDPQHIRLAALHEDKKNVLKENDSAAIVDLGDGCLCFEVHTKMNTIDDGVMSMLSDALDEAEKNFEALVIANDGDHFGAGANLQWVVEAAKKSQWDQIDRMVSELQGNLQRVRYSSIPVVTAPFQMALGGGAEMAMAGDAAQAHAETYIGLVEIGAGLIPAGTGCLRMVERWTGEVGKVATAPLQPFLAEAFMNMATARVSTGAEDARRCRYLRPTDGISLNRSHLLYHAKERALGMARSGYRPPRPAVFKAGGVDMAKTINVQVWGMVEAGWATEHDAVIARKLSHVLCGGTVAEGTMLDEQAYLDLEKEAFISLCGEEKSLARMESLLTTGKPLRN